MDILSKGPRTGSNSHVSLACVRLDMQIYYRLKFWLDNLGVLQSRSAGCLYLSHMVGSALMQARHVVDCYKLLPFLE